MRNWGKRKSVVSGWSGQQDARGRTKQGGCGALTAAARDRRVLFDGDRIENSVYLSDGLALGEAKEPAYPTYER